MGHKIGFGNTEEEERVRILGCKKRGLPTDKPMDHATGRGWVAPRKGHYYDALVVKRSRVIAAVIEATGGQSRPLSKQTRQLAKRTKGKGAVDRTNYGLTRRSTRSFEMHHKQRISLAAVMADAKAIRRRLLALKHSSSLSSRLRLLLSRRIGLSRPSTPVPPGGPARVRRNVMFSLAFAP